MYWIGIMVSIVGVCAIFVTVNPIINNIFIKEMRGRIKELEEKVKAYSKQTEELENSLKNLYSVFPTISKQIQQKNDKKEVFTKK